MITQKERLVAITKAADALAELLPLKEQEGFKRDYIAVMSNLNDRVAERLQEFEAEASEALVAHLPGRPGVIQEVVKKYVVNLWSLSNSIINVLEIMPVLDTQGPFAEAVKDIVDETVVALNDARIRSDKRSGLKLS